MRISSLPFIALAVLPLVMAGGSISHAQSVILSDTTRVTLTSSASAVAAGQPVTLTASVTTPYGGAVPGGTVQFIDQTTLKVLGWAEAAYPTIEFRELPPGRHAIRADYSGTDAFLPLLVQPSQSAPLDLIVQAVPQLVLASSRNPSISGDVVTLTLSVSADVALRTGAIPTGTVTFRDGNAVIASGVALDGCGVASFVTSALPEGVSSIQAEYHGDGVHAPAVSPPLDHTVAPYVIRDTSLLSRGM